MDDADALSRSIAMAEAAVAIARVETVVILDDSGHTRYSGAGEHDRVSAPVSVLKDSIVVHNHPGGGSLSRKDVRLMLEYEIAQIRAETDDAVFVLDLPDAVAWEDIADL